MITLSNYIFKVGLDLNDKFSGINIANRAALPWTALSSSYLTVLN
jgi:hypothetical protein